MKVVAILVLLSLLLVGCSSAPEDHSITLKTAKAPNQTDIVWIANHLCNTYYYPVIVVYDEPEYIRVKCSNPAEMITIEYTYDTQILKVEKI